MQTLNQNIAMVSCVSACFCHSQTGRGAFKADFSLGGSEREGGERGGSRAMEGGIRGGGLARDEEGVEPAKPSDSARLSVEG